MITSTPDLHGFQTFAYEKTAQDAPSVRAFLQATDLADKSSQTLDIRAARAARFQDFLIVRATLRAATLEWTRSTPTAQQRYMLYLVHRGALEVSGVAGTQHLAGTGVGIIHPGQGAITFRTLMEADVTLFTFDAQAVHPYSLDPGTVLSYPVGSAVLRAASAFFNGILASTGPHSLISTQILRRMTADIAIGLLSEAKGNLIDRSAITVRQIIDANYTNPEFTVQTLCDELRTSRRTLERICAEAGFSPSEALRLRRTEHAREVLLTGNQSPATAPWLHSGFTSSEQMRRAFLHYYDRTPKQILVESHQTEIRSVGPTGEDTLTGAAVPS